jgi:predicted NBD/HSP70 family sugar kinase
MEEIFKRARSGEGRALKTLRETAEHLGHGIAILVKTIDPRRVYLGGEITSVWGLVEPDVRRTLREQALIPEGGEVEILTVGLGEHPRLRGAAALVGSPAFAAPVVG